MSRQQLLAAAVSRQQSAWPDGEWAGVRTSAGHGWGHGPYGSSSCDAAGRTRAAGHLANCWRIVAPTLDRTGGFAPTVPPPRVEPPHRSQFGIDSGPRPGRLGAQHVDTSGRGSVTTRRSRQFRQEPRPDPTKRARSSSLRGDPSDRRLTALSVDEPVDVMWTIEGMLWRNRKSLWTTKILRELGLKPLVLRASGGVEIFLRAPPGARERIENQVHPSGSHREETAGDEAGGSGGKSGRSTASHPVKEEPRELILRGASSIVRIRGVFVSSEASPAEPAGWSESWAGIMCR